MPRFPDDVPTLTHGEVTLRAHRESDLRRIVEFANDPRSTRWVPLPRPYAEQQAREFLDSVRTSWQDDAGGRQWAIEVDGQFAGSIGLHHLTATTAELGYGAHPAIRGKGVMSRAARLVIEHGFDVLGLRTLAWRAAAGNFASRRVAWANGFQVDGTWPAMHPTGAGAPDDLWFGHLHHDQPREPAHRWFVPPMLEGAGIRLRPWRPDDTPPVGPDAAAQRFAEGMWPEPQEYTEWHRCRLERMAGGEGIFWCIAGAETDRPLGHVQVVRLQVDFTRGSGLLGYWIAPAARGKGLVQHTLDALIPYAFSARDKGGLGLHRLQAGTDAENPASQRTLRRAGFRLSATEREVLAHDDGPPTGALSFELLASDDRFATRVVPRPVPTLHTDRLTLRPWRQSDRPRPDQRLDVASALYLPAGAQPIAETFDDWLARRQSLRDSGTVLDWCIADRATDAALGSIGIFGIGEGTPTNAEIGYWLHVDARGRGYVTEALAATVTHAFLPTADGGMGLTRLHAGTDLSNIASQQLLERAGFARWGTDRQAYSRADGTYSDGAYYELLASDLTD
ncbi:GNAT family N-acetyltransferase [Leekyejoonella antrihumi]|uniref:GNAT N-acetyltransferase n=1 Tax=Leekyejoonella antrihumi TaxID=1660198 RepID=A0A563DY21_9MICO|nr:GNAT family N-acetyltransferase [Leekyejoonella antrihumi]TWP35105.1 GNAT N-acetyltransferase [Leekyejoonella antrihumi]